MGADNRRWPGRFWVLVALAAAVALGGCNNSDGTTPTATASSTPSSVTASPSASSSATKSETAAERDRRLAGEAVVEFWAVLDELGEDPGQDLKPLDSVARDQARAQWQVILGTYAQKGWVQQGKASLGDIQTTTRDGQSFEVTTCVDVADVELVDKNGVSQVNPNRPDRQKYTYTVVKADAGFFVTEDTLKGKPC